MTNLTARDLSFLHESAAIEDIIDIDYRLPENARAGSGHVGAYLESQAMAQAAAPLTSDAVCRWQGWLTDEQVRFGHSLPPGGAGALRSPEYPCNVIVGTHVPPPFQEVPRLFSEYLADLNRRARLIPAMSDDVEAADVLGEFFQRFEAIHPFVDGNGRTGRLIANHLATRLGQPILIFFRAERPAFYAAHRSRMAMRVFMADKIREAILWPGRGTLERQFQYESADRYEGIVVERHALLAKRKAWAEADARR